jgi:hypothetical protein
MLFPILKRLAQAGANLFPAFAGKLAFQAPDGAGQAREVSPNQFIILEAVYAAGQRFNIGRPGIDLPRQLLQSDARGNPAAAVEHAPNLVAIVGRLLYVSPDTAANDTIFV